MTITCIKRYIETDSLHGNKTSKKVNKQCSISKLVSIKKHMIIYAQILH